MSNKIIIKNNSYLTESESTLKEDKTINSAPHSDCFPQWFSGFSDGESNFTIGISKNNKLRTGWRIKCSFQIHLHIKDLGLLIRIKSFLGVGEIYEKENTALYQVTSLKELLVIIEQFDKYRLITQKRADFELFKQAVEILSRKEHLTDEGLHKIVSLKASLNNGLSKELQAEFPDITPELRPEVLQIPENIEGFIEPNWLSGFTAAEGCFLVWFRKSATNKIGSAVRLRFQLSQHSRDEVLVKSFVKYFGCGGYCDETYREVTHFRVDRFADIRDKIIPFFKKYPVIGVKALDFADFCKVASLIEDKGNLTSKGLEEIRLIKAGMNRGRSLTKEDL